VEGVIGGPVAGDLSVDACASGDGVVPAFEHEHAGALAHDEAIAAAIEGSARELGIVLRADMARISANAPKHRGASGASTPPATATSALPSRIRRNASPMAMVPEAQDMPLVELGPVKPNSMATAQLAAPTKVLSATRGSTARGLAP
jgi:hypothetical protein